MSVIALRMLRSGSSVQDPLDTEPEIGDGRGVIGMFYLGGG